MKVWQTTRALLTRFFRGDKLLSEEDAVKIAREYCIGENLAWIEPIMVRYWCGSCTVWTNYGARGNNVWIKIDTQSGAVLGKGVTPK